METPQYSPSSEKSSDAAKRQQENDGAQAGIQYFTSLEVIDQHIRDLTQERIQEFNNESGLDYSANNTMLNNSIEQIRRVRGLVVASFVTDPLIREVDEIDTLSSEERLLPSDLDLLFHDVATVATETGSLYWNRKLTKMIQTGELPFNEIAKLLQAKNAIEQQTQSIQDPRKYADYNNNLMRVLTYVYKWHQDARPVEEKIHSAGDDLGHHFDAHPYLVDINISRLRSFVERGKQNRIVLGANASSGVVEAGIIAHYMNEFLHLPTVVDPIFYKQLNSPELNLTKNETEGMTDDQIIKAIKNGRHFKRTTNSDLMREVPVGSLPIESFMTSETFGRDKEELLVIPFDDSIIGRGTSVRVACRAIAKKYGTERLLPGEYTKNRMPDELKTNGKASMPQDY